MKTSALHEVVDAAAGGFDFDSAQLGRLQALVNEATDELARIDQPPTPAHGPSAVSDYLDGLPQDMSLGEALGEGIGVTMGYVSRCWEPGPTGTFQSDLAAGAVRALVAFTMWRCTLAQSLAGGPLYAVLVEHNGHEGETWRFYIPCDGNQEALDELAELLDAVDSDDDDIEFTLDGVVQERYVDDRVSMGDSGYMAAHTKLAGKLVLPERDEFYVVDDEHAPWIVEILYKGKIRQLMTAD